MPCAEEGIARSARVLVAGRSSVRPPQLNKAKALIPCPAFCGEKGLLAPLASSSLALLGSNPETKKGKSTYPLPCLLWRKRDCSTLAPCGLLGSNPRNEKKAKAPIPNFCPVRRERIASLPLASSSLALLCSTPAIKKGKRISPLPCLLRRRGIAVRSRARRWRSSVQPPETKKAKALIPMLLLCGERGIQPPVRRSESTVFTTAAFPPLSSAFFFFSGGKSSPFLYSAKQKREKVIIQAYLVKL